MRALASIGLPVLRYLSLRTHTWAVVFIAMTMSPVGLTVVSSPKQMLWEDWPFFKATCTRPPSTIRLDSFDMRAIKSGKYVNFLHGLPAYRVIRQHCVEAIAAFNGALYGTSYDGGRVFRFDGQQWVDCGQLGDNTQTYSLAVVAGQLYVGTWPSGRVYRFKEPNQWDDCGRLGDELEVMGMLVHNGRLLGGTLPLAQVYQFDGQYRWQKLARLDQTPDVRYRRAWCMAEFGGQVFCSVLPSGKVHSWRAGRIAMADRILPDGWHHVAAIRGGDSLRIFVDGRQVAEESGFQPTDFDLSSQQPLKIGFGPNDYFQGRLSMVRLYRRALTADEIQATAEK